MKIQLAIVVLISLTSAFVAADSDDNVVEVGHSSEPLGPPLNETDIDLICNGQEFCAPICEEHGRCVPDYVLEDWEPQLCDPEKKIDIFDGNNILIQTEQELRNKLWETYKECSADGFQLGGVTVTTLEGNFTTDDQKVQAMYRALRTIRSVVIDHPSDDTTSDDTLSNDTLSNDTLSNDTLSNDTLSNDTLPNDTLPNDTLPNDTLANETLANETLANETLFNDTDGSSPESLDRHPRQAVDNLSDVIPCPASCGLATNRCATECVTGVMTDTGKNSTTAAQGDEPNMTKCTECLGDHAGKCLRCF